MQLQLNWQRRPPPSKLQSYACNLAIGKLYISMHADCLYQSTWFIDNHTQLMSSKALQNLIDDIWKNMPVNRLVSLQYQGTSFQRQVWQAISDIPRGQTRTYGELASAIKTSPRALANACRQNPFPFIIPCHRVLRKTSIGGYAGHTTGSLIDLKVALLQHEAG